MASGAVLIAGASKVDPDKREEALDRAAAILASGLGKKPSMEAFLAFRDFARRLLEEYEG